MRKEDRADGEGDAVERLEEEVSGGGRIHQYADPMEAAAPMTCSDHHLRQLRQAGARADGPRSLTERRSVATSDERDGRHFPVGDEG